MAACAAVLHPAPALLFVNCCELESSDCLLGHPRSTGVDTLDKPVSAAIVRSRSRGLQCLTYTPVTIGLRPPLYMLQTSPGSLAAPSVEPSLAVSQTFTRIAICSLHAILTSAFRFLLLCLTARLFALRNFATRSPGDWDLRGPLMLCLCLGFMLSPSVSILILDPSRTRSAGLARKICQS